MAPHCPPGNLDLDFEFWVCWIRCVDGVDSVFLVSVWEICDLVI